MKETAKAQASETVARVQNIRITLSEFNHWYAIARAAGSKPAKAYVNETMEFLISSAWVLGEGADRHIQLTASEVEHEYQTIRHQQFPGAREFHHFLVTSGQTEADLRLRVRLNLMSARIHQQLVTEGHGAVAGGLKQFRSKWRARTSCLPEFTNADCGGTLARTTPAEPN